MPKKPALTPEERRELKLQKKQEKKLKKAEEKKQVKRDHLDREVKYGSLSIKRYEKDWRQMLIKIAAPRMRQELEFAWHNFERVVDAKDFTISLLMDELKDAEEQYMRNFKNHCESLDDLMSMFAEQMEALKMDYLTEVEKFENKCDTEFEGMQKVSDDNLEYLRTMSYRLEVEKRDHERNVLGDYFSKLDENEVKWQLVLQKLKSTLETKYQNMFESTGQFLYDYNKQIKDKRKEHNKFKEQDETIQELIKEQFRKIKKCYHTIRLLKQRYNDMKQTEGNRILDLQGERNYFLNTFITLRVKMEADRKHDLQKLMCLSDSSRQAFDYLEKLNRKGEFVLAVAIACRKLETLKEKILPFPDFSLEGADLQSKRQGGIEEEEQKKHLRKETELFWQRVGQAAAVKYSLYRERRYLKDENEVFYESYEDYCDNLRFPPTKLYQPRCGKINKIDANIEFKKYEKFPTPDFQ